MFEVDPNSQSNLGEVTTNHIHMDVTVDFVKKNLAGTATLEIETLADTQEVVLDTAHLVINGASLLSSDGAPATALETDVSTVHKVYGTALRV
ncbi:Leucyl aminopeptidase yscIV, partial [Linderina pennispora]